MRKYNLITGTIWFTLGVFILLESFQLGLGKLNSPGPGFLPMLTSVALALLSVLLFLEATMEKNTTREKGPLSYRDINWNKIIQSILALTCYALLLERLGFLLSTFLLMTLLFKVAGTNKWPHIVLRSIISAILSYIIFGLLLHVQLPRGIIERIL
jgi:putative tricarboxylic transport membrane protein